MIDVLWAWLWLMIILFALLLAVLIFDDSERRR